MIKACARGIRLRFDADLQVLQMRVSMDKNYYHYDNYTILKIITKMLQCDQVGDVDVRVITP